MAEKGRFRLFGYRRQTYARRSVRGARLTARNQNRKRTHNFDEIMAEGSK
jgi:hypothetical protein